MKTPTPPTAADRVPRTTLRCHFDHAARVFVAGTFNHWITDGIPLEPDEMGNWSVSLALPPGRYEYRFLVDDVWQNPPDVTETLENPFGTHNAVLVVPHSR